MIGHKWIRRIDDGFQCIIFSGDDQILQVNRAIVFIGFV